MEIARQFRACSAYYPYPRVAPYSGVLRASCLWFTVSSKQSIGFDHIKILLIPIYNILKFYSHCSTQMCAKQAHACEGPVGSELHGCASVFISWAHKLNTYASHPFQTPA
jgi:hypothetical protein